MKKPLESNQSTALKVVCYAGYRSEEEPREFSLGMRKIQVLEIIDRWISTEHRYFKVRGSDGDTYILRYDVTKDQWELTMFSKEPKSTDAI